MPYLDLSDPPPAGTLLKYNSLWRLGAHYDWKVFRVSHVTQKGNVMGNLLKPHCETLFYDHDSRRDRWTIPTHPRPKHATVTRLKLPRLWEYVTADEKENGIVSTSCVS